jgi:hypothetical protein
MIVNRRTFIVKRGHLEEVAALVLAQQEGVDAERAFRLYLPDIGAFDKIAMEWEFEDLEEYRSSWDEWFSSPEAAAFMEKWNALTETGGTNEIWTLAE